MIEMMNDQLCESYMDEALKEARIALEEGEVPVGAVLVKDGRIIARGRNHREQRLDISSHAEIEALKAGAQALGTWDLSSCTLVVTLEPCLMCAGAIEQARISTLIYGADDPQEGAVTSKRAIFDDAEHGKRILIYRGIKKADCEALLRGFFYTRRT